MDDSYLETLLTRLNTAVASQNALGPKLDPQSPTVGAEQGEDALVPVSVDRRKDSPRDDNGPSLRQKIVEQRSIDPTAQVADCQDIPPDRIPGEFWPLAPADWTEMKLTPSAAEELALKFLMSRGTASGREIADHVAVPFGMLSVLLQQLKNSRLVVHRGAAQFGDYLYHLTESGLQTASRYDRQCGYNGPAPIALQDYVNSVHAQSIYRSPPTFEDIAKVFGDLVLGVDILEQVGQAIRAGFGFFLYGDSGNGKTSLAERVSRAFGKTIWIPRSLAVDGMIIRLFDSCNHVEVPPQNKDGLYDQLKIDRRWVRIRRPTIIVGGELTMDRLEIRPGSAPGIHEAPLQLKSNGGTLVVDDFGRQRMKAEELLNRWIVPLDRRIDILNLPNGKAIEVPFDQLLIFSTNMPPQQLADEAFLRRIPYKIRVMDPSEADFKELFKRESLRLGMRYCEETVDELIATHYLAAGRPLRCCHARDLLQQITHYCEFKQVPLEMTSERFASAVRNYFAATN
ncbi:MAG: AAA family ATPase [Planctomycetia bacterium]|nr:AAA family ATPase [Planctomycetia bacterium]